MAVSSGGFEYRDDSISKEKRCQAPNLGAVGNRHGIKEKGGYAYYLLFPHLAPGIFLPESFTF